MIKRKIRLLLLAVVAILTMGATTERTVYSKASNKDLKEKALQLVKNVRGIVDSYNKRDRELMSEYDRKDRPELSRGAANKLRQKWLEDSDAAHDAAMRKYKEHYWADAILLMRELNSRLPRRARQPELLKLYQNPTNVLGLAAIADHLELYSRSLPDG